MLYSASVFVFSVVFSYVALASNGFVPVIGEIADAADWITPPIAVILLLFLIHFIYRLFVPLTFRTEVYSNRVVFRSSKNPESAVLFRSDVVQFYGDDELVWCVSQDDQRKTTDRKFVDFSNASEFFDAIESEWGDARSLMMIPWNELYVGGKKTPRFGFPNQGDGDFGLPIEHLMQRGAGNCSRCFRSELWFRATPFQKSTRASW